MLVHVNHRLPSLHLTASKDPFRESMQYVQVKTFDEPGAYGPAGIYATATDAHTLAYCNLADHIGNLENVPGPEILIKADQYKKLTGPKVYFLDFAQPNQVISRDKQGQQLDAVPYLTTEQGPKYPNWPAVIPTMEPEPTGLIGIDPEKLAKICGVMNAGPLVVELRGAARPVMVQYLNPEDQGTARGLIMPVYMWGDRKERTDRAQAQANKAYQQAKATTAIRRAEGATA